MGADQESGSGLGDLKISEAPAAFAEFGKKHNALTTLIEAMQGASGVDVKVTAGNILITIDRSTFPGGLGSSASVGVYSSTLSIAGVLPTAGEISTAIVSAYSGQPAPRAQDIIHLKVGGLAKFRACVNASSSESGVSIWIVAFTVGGVTWYAHITQLGLY